jgi:Fe-S cluster assembly iron-binding protein IscA
LGLTLDESKDSKETSFYQDKIKFLVDERLKDMIDDDIPVSIDFNKSLFGEGFIAKYGNIDCHE